MSTVNEYLYEILNKKQNNNGYSQSESLAYNYITNLINKWHQNINNYMMSCGFWKNIKINIQLSGSKAKGDAIKGKSDVDIFVSIDDEDNWMTVKQYYESLYDFLKQYFNESNIRRQNVSIGINYAGCSIDVTPGKKIKRQANFTFENYEDHYIYSRKSDKITQTNIQKHIDLVKYSGLKEEMMILKIWRNCHCLELPSIAIEIITNETLKDNKTNSLYSNVKMVFESIKKTIMTCNILDPSNSNNDIADSMTYSEKLAIKNKAIEALSYDYGETVAIRNIVW